MFGLQACRSTKFPVSCHTCRSVSSPYKLVNTFPAPDDDIRTLHDNFEKSIGRFPHVRCEGLLCAPWGGVLSQALHASLHDTKACTK